MREAGRFFKPAGKGRAAGMARFRRAVLSIFLASSIASGLLAAAVWLPAFPKELLEDGNSALLLTDRRGRPIRESPWRGERRTAQWVGLKEIAPAVVWATTAIEDARFFRHPGVDPLATVRAAWRNRRAGRIVSGGSTLTQQTVRLMRPAPRTYRNKLTEAVLALRLERTLAKREILERYLNLAPYGNGAYGVAAASRIYFDKPPSDLSLAESAFLAGLPQSPSGYDPFRRFSLARKRQRRVLDAMRAKGYITRAQHDGALAERLALVEAPPSFFAPHFAEYAATELEGAVSRGAVRVRCALDLDLQRTAEGVIRRRLGELRGKNVGDAAAVVIHNPTGEVLAMVGSDDFFDPANGQNNGALARRQPGSALKPFLYAAALDRGLTAADVLPDVEMHFAARDGDYSPRNYDGRFHGPVRARMALANSLNAPAIFLAEKFGVNALMERLARFGFTTFDGEASHYGLGLALGDGEVTLLELTSAYAALANLGEYRPPRVALSCETRRGAKIDCGEGRARPSRAVSPQAAYIVADILSDASSRAPTFGRRGALSLPFRAAAKTGTSSNFRDNWAVGFTREITVGVWAGNFNGEPMREVSGVTGSGPILRDVLRAAAENRRKGWLRRPGRLAEARVCPLSGKRPGPHCPSSILELFVEEKTPHETCAMHRPVMVDVRNGLAAGRDCPPEWTVEEVFAFYPPQFLDWAVQHGIALPPSRRSPLCAREKKTVARAANDPIVLFPKDGDVFAIDPTVAKPYRSIVLEAAVPEGAQAVTWRVDGKEIARPHFPFSTPWGLQRGKRRIEVAADGRAGKPVTIFVE